MNRDLKGFLRALGLAAAVACPSAGAWAVPARENAGVRRCSVSVEELGGSFKVMRRDGWTILVSQQKETGGLAYGSFFRICLNERQFIHFPGLLFRFQSDPEGNLMVDSILPRGFIDPSLLEDWQVEDRQVVTRDGVRYSLVGRRLYSLPRESLSVLRIHRVSANWIAPAEDVAVATLDFEPSRVTEAGSMLVSLYEADEPSEAEERVRKFLSAFAGKSPLYGDEGLRASLLRFVREEAGRYKGRWLQPNARLRINLLESKDLRDTASADYREIVPEIVSAEGVRHEKLVYCPLKGGLETLSEHGPHMKR